MSKDKGAFLKVVVFVLVLALVFTASIFMQGSDDFVFAGQTSKTPETEFKVYRSVKYGFAFRYPADFTVKETDSGVRVYFPKTTKWREYIFKNDVVSAYVDVGISNLDVIQSGTLCSSNILSDKKVIILNGKRFQYGTFNEAAMGGRYFDYEVYTTQHLGKCYHIALVIKGEGVGAGAHNGKGPQPGDYAPKSAKQEFLSVLKRIVLSFEFLPGKRKISVMFTIGEPIMTVNGIKAEIDPGRGTVPVIVPAWGRTVLPIRALVEALGGSVSWNGKERSVVIYLGDRQIVLWIGKSEAYVNSKAVQIDPKNRSVKPIIINGRTMIPVRFVAESLGCKVSWNGKTKQVTIIYDKGVSMLKENCIYAAMKGISTDIVRVESWLKSSGNLTDNKISELKAKLSELKEALAKYKTISVSQYKLPEKREIIGWISEKGDALLYSEGMSRSGPFYHIAGIYSGTLNTLEPKVKYRMTIYLVYPRIYPFPDYYVYVASVEKANGK